MNAKLEALRKLHELDVKIIRLKSRRKAIPQMLQRLEEDIERRKAAVDDLHQQLIQTRAKSDRFDLDIRSREAIIQRLEEQLAKVSSNKQYAALRKQIASKKADLSKLEDQALAALNAIDELVEQHREAQKQLELTQQARDHEAGSIQASMDQIEQDLTSLQQQRPDLAGQVEPDLLSRYERVLPKRGETTLVPVINGTCQGCFMKVTPEDANALKRKQEVILCKTCARILYLP